MSPGVNLVGFLDADLGIGEAARQIGYALELAGVPVSRRTLDLDATRASRPRISAADGPLRQVTVSCVNPPELLPFVGVAEEALFRERPAVGVWWWETRPLAPAWLPALDVVDEVWAGSEFVAETIRQANAKSVRTFPLPVRPPDQPRVSKADAGLPDRFVFLFSFDFFSTLERKNPLGLVDAYRRAFRPDEGAFLVVKTVNGDACRADLARLHEATADREDIEVRDVRLAERPNQALMGACDCYVSLHRAEGFGLTLAQAMAQGVPTIATGYSGNLAFMDTTNSFLVDFRLVTIPEGFGPYPPGSRWAEPDIAQAASLMRRVRDDPGAARAVGLAGRAAIVERHAPERSGVVLRELLLEVWERRGAASRRFRRTRSWFRRSPAGANRMLPPSVG